jgi:F-type H+-transporting ATPase subunit gamma
MASLRDIRQRIDSVRNTQQVTRAMKMVAAAKLRRAQERIFQTRPYAFKIADIISHLKSKASVEEHDLLATRTERKAALLVIVTADRGLAGAFNANVIKLAETTIQRQYQEMHAAGNLYLLCVGRKGHEYFQKRGYQLIGEYRGLFDRLSVEDAYRVVEAAVKGYREGRWDEVNVVYNEFKNTISQNRVVEPFLPLPESRFMTPVMEHEIGYVPRLKEGIEAEYLYEPDPQHIMDKLVPRYLNYQMWRVLLESNASEQGARMVAMDNATSNAQELLKDLRLRYNRARQDAITKELIEITSGADALGA